MLIRVKYLKCEVEDMRWIRGQVVCSYNIVFSLEDR